MEDLFQTAFGITYPWYIESLNFDTEKSRLDIYINFRRGATFRDNKENDPFGKEYHASKLTCVSDHHLWTVLELYVKAARFDEDYSELHTIGMDEPKFSS